MWLDPWVRKTSWRRGRQPQHSCLGKSHGQRSLVGYNPWGRKGFCDTAYQLRAETLQMRLKKWDKRKTASLTAKWQGTCRPVRETQIHPLIWEDPTCCGATRPVSHNC